MRTMNLDGVVYRPLKEPAPSAVLTLASRRGEASEIVRKFVNFARRKVTERRNA